MDLKRERATPILNFEDVNLVSEWKPSEGVEVDLDDEL